MWYHEVMDNVTWWLVAHTEKSPLAESAPTAELFQHYREAVHRARRAGADIGPAMGLHGWSEVMTSL